MLDTAAVALEVLEREPTTTRRGLAEALELPEELACRFAAFVAGVHDLGKATPVFQCRWEPGARAVQAEGLPFPAVVSGQSVPHGALTEHLLRRWLERQGIGRQLARQVARAAAAHHGFLPDPSEVARGDPVAGSGPWDHARDALLGAILEALAPVQWPSVRALPPRAAVLLTALSSFSDWLASAEHLFPYGQLAEDARRYLEQARDRARRALDRVGWQPRRPLADGIPSFQEVFSLTPNSLQETVAAAVADTCSPVLVLIEAPMGAGKTEAALYAHLLLQQRLQHRGLFVALPTMATGNAMFPRVRDFLARFAGRMVDLHLQHSLALLHEDYRTLRLRAVGEDVTADEPQNVVAAEWFTPTKRAILSEYGVGTVDQALLGVLRVRHHFVRLFGLANRTVVLDEVHAYDTYTSGLIEALLTWLRGQGSSVILMSATLPAGRRRALLHAYGACELREVAAYPRVTVVAGGKAESRPVDWKRPQRVVLRSAPKTAAALGELAQENAGRGGCVLCVVNTVERAQHVYTALGDGQPILDSSGFTVGKRCGELEVFLVHARFPAECREARERCLVARFGRQGYKEGSRPQRALVIATQVAEQSLDVDFDLLITDLAPIDLIAQRAGRLHRFPDVPRPSGFAEPLCLVAGGPPELPDLEDWQRVYSGYVLLRSWAVLYGRDAINIPDDLQGLVDLVYGDKEPEFPAALREAVRQHREKHLEEQGRLKAWVRQNAVPEEQLLEWSHGLLAALRLEDDEDAESQAPLTRVGEPSVTVVICHRIGGRLYLDPQGLQPVDPGHAPDDATALQILRKAVRLSGGLVYSLLRDQEVPRGWRQHPLLRRLRLLELADGLANLGVLRIRLDPGLGIVYEYRR